MEASMKFVMLIAGLGVALAIFCHPVGSADAAARRHHAAYARSHVQHHARTARHGSRRYAALHGGYHGKMTRNEILYGPAGMPPAPHDFGPHFDYPPESLNGGPTNAPYLH
jgi:hypothetical protein